MAQIEFIYKIVPSAPGVPVTSSGQLPNDYVLPVSDLDKRDGFMHMSTANQVPGTLKRFFPTSTSSRDSIFLLRAPYHPLEGIGAIRWEDPAGQQGSVGQEGVFPHIYDDKQFKLNHEIVDSVAEVVSEKGDEGWESALAKLIKDGWLQ